MTALLLTSQAPRRVPCEITTHMGPHTHATWKFCKNFMFDTTQLSRVTQTYHTLLSVTTVADTQCWPIGRPTFRPNHYHHHRYLTTC